MNDPDWSDLARWGKRAADWGVEYHATKRDKPVRGPGVPR